MTVFACCVKEHNLGDFEALRDGCVRLVYLTCHFNCQDEKYWPLMPPLPSYGYGRERPGPRYGSLIHGQNLKDIVITG
jgi:hypothetical protein